MRWLFLILFLVPATADAADCKRAYDTQTGKAIPCDGVLLPHEWAARGFKCVEVELKRCEIEYDSDMQSCEIHIEEAEKKQTACNRALARLSDLASKAAIGYEPAWYESPYFAAAVGFIVGSGTTVGIVYALSGGL